MSGAKGAAMPSTPTVSVWPQSIRVGPSPAPSAIATTLTRPGAISSTRTSKPARRIHCPMHCAIAASPAPPSTSEGFTESIATSSRSRSTTGSMAGRFLRPPVGDEDVGVAGLRVVAVGRKDQVRAVRREHREAVEGRVVRDAFEAGAIDIDEVQLEVALLRVLVVRREDDPLAVRRE